MADSVEEHVEVFKEWVGTLREDVEAIKSLVDNEKADVKARRWAASSLLYLVARMDLVPDWEESIGVLDDVMVLRQVMHIATQLDYDEGLESDDMIALSRLANENDRIDDFLGAELAAKFGKYCETLSGKEVRGLSPYGIVDDKEARKLLYTQITRDIKRLPPAPFANPEQIQLKFKNYLQHKLG